MEVLFRPNVPDNEDSWQVFDDDKHIQQFIDGTWPFTNLCFEGNHNDDQLLDDKERSESGVIQLKGNRIPSHLVSLEKNFNKHDAYIERERDKKGDTCGEYDGINIGTEDSPKMIIIEKCCTPEERIEIRKLLIEYQDVFAWSYEDFKNFMDGRFKHTIPLNLGVEPFKQKQRNYNPLVEGAIFKEIDKMLKARIIYPIHHSTWVANIVPMRKKNEEIRICVDFRNLNQASLKDNFALPNMDHLLQEVVGSKMMSMLDGFLGYNQIQVDDVDQHKKDFTTLWGTFA